jgi:UDP:flavonoid glycosyltransferase YjiC (YdhE family)
VLDDPRYAERARAIARWSAANDGAAAAAEAVEELAVMSQ